MRSAKSASRASKGNRLVRLLKSFLVVALFFAFVAIVCSAKMNSSPQAQSNNCSTCHAQKKDQLVELFSRSTHAKANIKCNLCHGGDPTASSKAAAHAKNFAGKFTPNETLAMCGSCHGVPLEKFKASVHFPERRGAPRMDCVQCHGAH